MFTYKQTCIFYFALGLSFIIFHTSLYSQWKGICVKKTLLEESDRYRYGLVLSKNKKIKKKGKKM